MSDLSAALRSISSDLKQLLLEEQEKSPTLFVSSTSMERYPSPTLAPPPRQPLPAGKKFSPQKPRPREEAPPPAPIPKKQEAAPTPEVKKEAPPSSFALEPLGTSESSSFADPFAGQGTIAKRVQKLFPGWKLREHPLSDEEAVKIASSWKIRAATTEVLVLLFSTKPPARSFLQNFASALNRQIAPAQLIDARSIEKENMWEAVLSAPTLKTIYAPPLESWNAPHLLKYVKAIPATGENYLGNCRLHLLQEAEIYMNSPEKKRLLWQQICRLR